MEQRNSCINIVVMNTACPIKLTLRWFNVIGFIDKNIYFIEIISFSKFSKGQPSIDIMSTF
jgi:hypothetical protein